MSRLRRCVCDLAENCTGFGLPCPATRSLSATAMSPSAASATRPRTARVAGAACPADAFAIVGDGLPRLGGRSATWPRTARSSAACPADRSRLGDECRRRRRLRRGRELHRLERAPARRTAFASSATVMSRLGRCLRRGRELHRVERGLPGDTLRASSATVCRSRPASATWPRTARVGPPRVPATRSSPSATVCRPSAGVCDVAENCTGSSADLSRPTRSCPPRRSVAASAGVCDVAENCTGSAAACPSRRVRRARRPSAARRRRLRRGRELHRLGRGLPGRRVRVVGDRLSVLGRRLRLGRELHRLGGGLPGRRRSCSSATVCRSSAGVCDVAENCTGSGVTVRRLRSCSSSTVCRSRRRLRRGRELHRARGGVPGRRVRVVGDASAAARPASATSPRTAPARARRARRRVRLVLDASAAARPASATSPRTARARAPPARPTLRRIGDGLPLARPAICDVVENCDRRRAATVRRDALRDLGDRLPRLGRHLRPRRELHRLERAVSRGCARHGVVCRPPRPVSATRPRAATASSSNCPGNGFALERDHLSRRRPASATSPRTAPGSGANCPADAFDRRRPSAAARQASATLTENCTGSGAACPADVEEHRRSAALGAASAT